jgi:dipeptidyl aminopeptidase/acylaminoacyl peptidase
VTRSPGNQGVPSWSADGAYIYFTADRGKGRNLWRVPAAGGTEEQITNTKTGPAVRLTADGASILYQPEDDESPLMTQPLRGGSARQVAPCVERWAFADLTRGLYYVACPALVGGGVAVHLIERLTGQDRLLGVLKNWSCGFTVSPDGQTILYARQVRDDSDLMLIENFR